MRAKAFVLADSPLGMLIRTASTLSTCAMCGRRGTPDTFDPKYKHRCMPCAMTTRRSRRRVRRLRNKYGLTVAEWEQMLANQCGRCAACGDELPIGSGESRTRKIATDHCHKTGRVRGLLHIRCNIAVGMLGESPDTARMILDYMERNRCHSHEETH